MKKWGILVEIWKLLPLLLSHFSHVWLCANRIDGSPPGSPVPGILQARTLEWVPFPSPMHAWMLSRFSSVQLCETLWTAAHQAPLSPGFSRQESWSGLLFPSPGDLPDPGMEPRLPSLQADSLPSEPPGKPWVSSVVMQTHCTTWLLWVTLLVTKGVSDKGNQGKYEVYAACSAVISPLSLNQVSVSPATIHKRVAG